MAWERHQVILECANDNRAINNTQIVIYNESDYVYRNRMIYNRPLGNIQSVLSVPSL